MFAYQYWADTTTGILKQRNSANTAWISLWTIATCAWLGNAATATSLTGCKFSVHKNGTAQTVVAYTPTLVTWSTEEFDINSNFSTNRFTPTTAGKYCISANVTNTLATAGSLSLIAIYKNGVSHKVGYAQAASAGYVGTNVSAIVDANGSTDYFEIYISHSGTNLHGDSDKTYFTGFYIGA
jgi:hypothetical protein